MPAEGGDGRGGAARALACGLSLSLGWGIRGNFGHEYGAMVPGALAALALCLLSGREDWRRRFPHFAFFGALGWGFGGSISYMQVIAYTHSGHLPSQLYGFAALFAIGFLWAALGAAGTLLPATLDRRGLTALYRPLLWILASWVVLDLVEPLIEARLERFDTNRHRHESPLYWFDADWLPALTALAAAGLEPAIAELLVRVEGDAAMWGSRELLTNWPEFFRDIPEHLGWIAGLAAGAGIHFARRGAFRHGSALFLHMALGWWAGFLLLPVLLGVRMTPPRADDWAGILGVLCGVALYFARRRWRAALAALLACGAIGGLGFSGAAWLKLILVAPGNAALVEDAATRAAWSHWQSANWHSVLEQLYGLINGIGIAVALGLLIPRLPPLDGAEDGAPPPDGSARAAGRRPAGRLTGIFAAGFVLVGITYLNLSKNVGAWTEPRGGFQSVPDALRAPLAGSIELSASAWFTLAYAGIAATYAVLALAHLRRPLAVLPATSLGRGQLLYILFLWWMVAGNFERALVGFREQRLITEGVIFANGLALTALILLLPRAVREVGSGPMGGPLDTGRLLRRSALAAVASLLIAVPVQTATVRAIYGERHAGHSGRHLRFGDEATWRTSPLRRGAEHP